MNREPSTPQPSVLARLVRRIRQSRIALDRTGFTLIEALILGAMLMVTVVTFSSWNFQRARLTKMREEQRNAERVANNIKTAAVQSESLTATEEQMFNPALPTPTP